MKQAQNRSKFQYNAPRGTCEVFEQIFHHGPVAMIQLNPQGKIIDANHHTAGLMGLSLDRLIGQVFKKPDWSIATQEGADLPDQEWVFQQVVEMGTAIEDCVQTVRCPDGTEKTLNITGVPLLNEEGVTDRFVFALQDISENENLRKEVEKYTSLLDATSRMAQVGGWELIVATNEVRWTKETYRIHELPINSDFRLEEALSYYHPDDRPLLLQALQDAKEQGKPYDLELRITTAKGNERITRAICTPILEKGKVVSLQGTFQDITIQKQTERALQESEKRYRRVTENSPAVVAQYQMDPEGNVSFLFITDTIYNQLGVSAESVMRDASILMQMIHPDDLGGYREASLESFRNLSEFHHELRVIKPDGDLYWAEIHSVPEQQPDGSVIWDGFFREITERKQAEKKLILQHDLLKIAGETSKFGGWAVDLVNNIHFWSDTVKQIHDVPEDFQPSLQDGIHFYAPEYRDMITRAFTACVEKGTPYNQELELITAKGNRIWVRTCGRADVNAEGIITGVHGSLQDITEEKEMQERLRESEKMEAVGKLAGGIAHEFNNQLSGILGFAELLKSELPEPSHQQYIQHIITAAGRSAGLTKKILAFARKDTFLKTPLKVHELIQETIDSLNRTNDKAIHIQKQFLADPPIIKGDARSIQSGLLHVCQNACEAMPEGGELVISTEVRKVDETYAIVHQVCLSNGSYLAISIKDTGCGIPKQMLRHVVEPFFTTKPFVEGAGMGLSAVYGMVKAHGGEVEIQSEEGKGTSVTLYFPVFRCLV